MLEKIKERLVDDSRYAHKMASMWIIAIIGVLDQLYLHMPFVQQYLPQGYVTVMAVLALGARLYKQNLPGGKE